MHQLVLPGVPDVAPLDERDIRADYEALLDRCARLMAYAQSSPRHIPWPVVHRQNRLAEDDLIIFALRARRFINATSLVGLAHNVVVPVGPVAPNEYHSIWRVINTLIHYTDIALVRTSQFIENVFLGLQGKLRLEDLIIDPDSRAISPLVWLSSEHEPSVDFGLLALLQIFCGRILLPAIVICRDRGIELASVNQDFDRIVNQDFDRIIEQLSKIQGNDVIAAWRRASRS